MTANNLLILLCLALLSAASCIDSLVVPLDTAIDEIRLYRRGAGQTTSTSFSTPTGTYTVTEPVPTPEPTIGYKPGNVMANGINLYAIFYGNFPKTTRPLVQKFVNGLGKSDWWSVIRRYNGVNGVINDNITWGGSFDDAYSQQNHISDIDKVIDNAIAKANWPKDPNGIYSVFASADVSQAQGWFGKDGHSCTDYCGYHKRTSSSKLLYVFVADATRCPGTLPPPGASKGTSGCMQRYYRNQTDTTYSVNGDQHADSMVNTLAHELAETATDFDDSWRDPKGNENADKCSTQFVHIQGIGATSPYNGAYNVDFGENGRYLIQSIWAEDLQRCVLAP